MNSRSKQAHDSDAIAGAALVTIGTIALIARLGLLTFQTISAELLQWWPLLLIVLGVGLWAFEQESREKQSHGPEEAKYVR